jgi:hypothetical protein
MSVLTTLTSQIEGPMGASAFAPARIGIVGHLDIWRTLADEPTTGPRSLSVESSGPPVRTCESRGA